MHVLGDGAIDVRDDDFVVPVPQVDGALAAARALVLGGDAKRHVIGTLLQFQTRLVTEGNSEGICMRSSFHSLMCSTSAGINIQLY